MNTYIDDADNTRDAFSCGHISDGPFSSSMIVASVA